MLSAASGMTGHSRPSWYIHPLCSHPPLEPHEYAVCPSVSALQANAHQSMSRAAPLLPQTHDSLWMPRSLRNVQMGMNVNANEELHRQHYGFYTFGLFTSRRRALACIQMRGMTTGALSILPVSINEPLRPCLGSDVLTAHETREMVSTSPLTHSSGKRRADTIPDQAHHVHISVSASLGCRARAMSHCCTQCADGVVCIRADKAVSQLRRAEKS